MTGMDTVQANFGISNLLRLLVVVLLTLGVWMIAGISAAAQSTSETAATTSVDASSSTTAADSDDMNVADRLRAAFETTSTLTTPEEATKIIEICEAALAGQASEEDRRYARRLASWAYCKRADLAIPKHVDLPISDAPSSENSDSNASSDAVMTDLNHAVEFDPSNWRARVLRAVVRGRAAQYQEALADLDRALRENDKARNAWFNRAEIRSHMGENVLAIEDYSHAIVLDPRDAEAYTGRGHALFRLGKYQEALSDYQKVVLLTSGTSQALIHRGDVLAAANLYAKAKEDYELALARDKSSGVPHQRMAWLIATAPAGSLGSVEQAVALAETAVQLRPNDWSAVETLATTLGLADRNEEAMKVLESWAEAHPTQEQEKLVALRERLTVDR